MMKYPMTWCIAGLTSLVTILQFIYEPELLALLQRDPQALAAGEWWRIITPLFVHADGWWQYLFNIISMTIIGVEIERLYGKYKFLILYLIGGLAGEIAGYAGWELYGAGASVGMCGLAGGLFVIMLNRKNQIRLIPAMFSLYLVLALVGLASENLYITIGLFFVAFIISGILIRRNQRLPLLGVYMAGCGWLGAIALLGLQDIHGAAIMAGILATIILHMRYL